MIAAAGAALLVSAILLKNLWFRKNESLLKKIIWTPIILFPVIGWIFYGGFYTPPGTNQIRAKGGASGWKPGLK